MTSFMFERVPPRVKAIQWDGTLEGAEAVANFVAKIIGNTCFTVTSYGEATGGYIKNDYSHILNIERLSNDVIREGCWLVSNDENHVEIVLDETFQRNYKPI